MTLAAMTLAAESDYPFLDLMWTIALFFGLMIFLWLLITVFGDLFRRDDISGWAKTAWTVFVIVLPIIGSATYLISQGRGMAARNLATAKHAKQETDEYIRSVAGDRRYAAVDEVARAKTLLDNGAISRDEFEEIKRRVLV
jgi:hypothetical protein